MTAVDLQPLTTTLSSESPSGENLEYDHRFVDMLRLSEGTREQQYGNTIIAAQSPEWNTIHQLASNLASETRDLRVAVMLVESLTHLEGLSGLADGLTLLQNWVTNFWDDVHPQLDPSDDNDPFVRINSLARLCEPERLLMLIGRIRLIEAPPHLVVMVNDVLRPNGETNTSHSHADRPTPMEVDAAFLAMSVTDLRRLHELCNRADNALKQTIVFLEQTLGPGAWDAVALLDKIANCRNILKTKLRGRLSASETIIKDNSDEDCDAEAIDGENETWNSDGVDETMRDMARVRVQSREDAAYVLDAATKYFETHEPSSPVPLLLRRARRMINQDFVDIIRELAPDALAQARNLAGDFEEG
jgi:type VI secretion system protein ImpA